MITRRLLAAGLGSRVSSEIEGLAAWKTAQDPPYLLKGSFLSRASSRIDQRPRLHDRLSDVGSGLEAGAVDV